MLFRLLSLVLRRIQDVFDTAADDETRNALLRGLPIPEAQRDKHLLEQRHLHRRRGGKAHLRMSTGILWRLLREHLDAGVPDPV